VSEIIFKLRFEEKIIKIKKNPERAKVRSGLAVTLSRFVLRLGVWASKPIAIDSRPSILICPQRQSGPTGEEKGSLRSLAEFALIGQERGRLR